MHAAANIRKFACAIDAPIDMSFADASRGLMTQALRRHAGRGGLSSSQMFTTQNGRNRHRAAQAKSRFDPFEMLRRLAA